MTVQLLGHARGRPRQGSISPGTAAPLPRRLGRAVGWRHPSPLAPRPSLPVPPRRPIGKAAPLPFSGSLHPDPVLSPSPPAPTLLPPDRRTYGSDGATATQSLAAAAQRLWRWALCAGGPRAASPGQPDAQAAHGRAASAAGSPGARRRETRGLGSASRESPVGQPLTAECGRSSSFSSRDPF